MDHKIIVAENLRAGLAKLKDHYTYLFYASSSFRDQWECFIIKEAYDIDWYQHKELIEINFAWKSRCLLRRIQGD